MKCHSLLIEIYNEVLKLATKNGDKFNAILDAALTIFAEHGFHGSQVNKIAKEAGIAGGTVYLYFKNKEDILVHLFQTRLGRMIDRVEQEIHQAPNAIKALEAVCRTHFLNSEQNPQLAYVMQIELRQANLELRKEIGQVVKVYYELIEKIIVRGINEGIFRKDLDPKMARSLIFGAMDEMVTSWIVTGKKFSLSAQIEGTSRFIINGLR
jgi:TetR/AcrR family fatty acid metabolism transcriptional regulator